MMKIVLLLSMMGGVLSASMITNWPQIQDIKSGDHKLLRTSTPGIANFTYIQAYYTNPIPTTFSAPTRIALCIRDLNIDQTTTTIDYKVYIDSATITASQFISTVQINSNVTIGLLYYMFIAFAQDYPHTYVFTQSFTNNNTNNNSSIIVSQYNQTLNTTITNFGQALAYPFVRSFKMTAGSQYSYRSEGTLVDSSTVTITITTNCTLERVDISLVVIDVASYQDGFVNFFDYGTRIAQDSGASDVSTFNPFSFNYFNYVIALTQMRVPSTSAINFEVTFSTINTITSYTYLKYDLVHWRLRQCADTSIPYYVFEEQRCYDSCSNVTSGTYGTNDNTSYCPLCSYTCASCGNLSQTCLTCNSSNSRTLDNSTCPCDSAFFDAGVAACEACDYTCLTCQSASTSCLSCPSTRTLTNSSCPCDNGLYDTNSSNATCDSCHYSCLTCSGSSSTCLSCNTTANRLLDSQTSQCLCNSGFEENGTSVQCVVSIVICVNPCITCSIVGSNCTSCDSSLNRELSGNQCACLSGYSSPSTTGACSDTCGDGTIQENTTQCDDGNTNDGDGCSSQCAIQSGYSCNYTAPGPSVCVSITGYTLTTSELIKDPASNTLTARLAASPSLPSTSVPSLTTLQDALTIISYSNSGSSMSVSMTILREIKPSQTLQLSLSQVSATTRVAMQATNRLQIKPYDNSYYTAHQVATYMVWGYVGLLWLFGLLFTVLDYRLFSGVMEVFMYSGVAWVGVEGQQTYSLLYQPLLRLKYIFVYNIGLNSQSSLFQVYNISLAVFILPFVVFICMVVCGSRCREGVSIKAKRFVLFDMPYAWLVFNGIMVSYGLGLTLQSTSSIDGLGIAGLAFAGVYFAVCFIVTFCLFCRRQDEEQINPRLQITKLNLFKPKLYPITIFLLYLVLTAYIWLTTKTHLNSLTIIGYCILMTFFLGLSKIFINKTRSMLNLLSLILIYLCILVINNVSNAAWTGLTVLGLLYLQLIINSGFLYCQRNSRELLVEEFDDTERAKAIIEGALAHQTNPVEFDMAPYGEYEHPAPNEFTVYSTNKKQHGGHQYMSNVSQNSQPNTVQKQGKMQEEELHSARGGRINDSLMTPAVSRDARQQEMVNVTSRRGNY